MFFLRCKTRALACGSGGGGVIARKPMPPSLPGPGRRHLRGSGVFCFPRVLCLLRFVGVSQIHPLPRARTQGESVVSRRYQVFEGNTRQRKANSFLNCSILESNII